MAKSNLEGAVGRTKSFEGALPLPSDIEIARKATLEPIASVGREIGLNDDELELYGEFKAKVKQNAFDRLVDREDGKLILVTGMTPTRSGEGKTLTSIGLAQAFGKLNHLHLLVLREPSLGPTFGIKGGATGGGFAQVLPMEEINIHFTGDLHAVTAAHNLLAATVDNHVFQGNELGIDPDKIILRRVMDLCDRQLRDCKIGLGPPTNGFPHRNGFDITAASEVMAILALASQARDLRERLGKIIVAYTRKDEPVFADQFGCIGAMMVLLKDALNPNLVQTIENTPALIHCGPFANIAHGCNSVRATRLALKLADYVVTESGFAADLGAEKFINIKCRASGIQPNAAVFVVSCKALKRHGGVREKKLSGVDIEALKRGFENVRCHLKSLAEFGIPVIVAINRFPEDKCSELDTVFNLCQDEGVEAALSEVASLGSNGGLELAQKVLTVLHAWRGKASSFQFLYEQDAPVREKIEIVARKVYHADGVEFHEEAEADIRRLERLHLDALPICIAKTQFSISDDPKKLGAPKGWRLKVRNVKLNNGAGFLVAITGQTMLMPGMPKQSNLENIGIDDEGKIFGLS
ncbi:MAG: Formate--tetrahydrofolate ligase [Candidatus Moanabacter tarae]|uniref:Formate--tetrahydrofolate ligase n=1 Tax=Candidatus Moanibacter tarae TaxID=2200854 RepID=A0A2Z4AFA0_9BACT|nr:MAG: Formate--tetrahydrofolate ligase [Candidatus Moanabacter tarae]|tara:strand:+ start:11323 stop:13065 length:1743 start_codon:yes stop_codon:yes gene_type:complete